MFYTTQQEDTTIMWSAYGPVAVPMAFRSLNDAVAALAETIIMTTNPNEKGQN